jgi:hypothetical protein
MHAAIWPPRFSAVEPRGQDNGLGPEHSSYYAVVCMVVCVCLFISGFLLPSSWPVCGTHPVRWKCGLQSATEAQVGVNYQSQA